MITQQQPIAAHLRNRDLKRELRLIPPGYHELINGVRVYRFDGEDTHRYAINGNEVTLDQTAAICSGSQPVPAYPVIHHMRKARKPVTRKPRTPKAKAKPDVLPLNTLPMFAGLVSA